tara:strand:- start:93 stop:830 length:738 start_codon:yes stop_codon:yes gene_type:complete
MKTRLSFYLVKFPTFSISLFFVLTIIAAIIYPGSVREGIDFECEHYSFTHNFLSELGTFSVSSDDANPFSIKQDNTTSMLLFNGSLVLIGFTIVMFYVFFEKLFLFAGDSKLSVKYAKVAKPLGILAGVMYAGVGLVPHDLHFGVHVFFANGAFLTLLFLCIFHALAVYRSECLANRYVLGYVLFIVFLAIYLVIIFFGPQIGPGSVYTESDLILQVVAQKLIVLTFIFSILFQVWGVRNFLKQN